MILSQTSALLENRRKDKILDDYVVMVGYKGSDSVITSPGANGDSLFDIASTGKVLITSTLILKAINEKRIALEDTLDKFFENVPEDKKHITVFDLLTHTSGIIRFDIPKEVCAKRNDTIANYILSEPLAFKPGTEYRYSCTGYILLGFIAEKAFNAGLDELFYTYIKQPLKLTRSGFNMPVDEVNSINCCYSRKDYGDTAVGDEIVKNMRGCVAGNGCSFWTANDYLKWVKAVMNKSDIFYGEELYAKAEKNYTPDFSEGRGLGYLIVDENYPQTGKLFPVGSFGHCGHSGVSFFINRQLDLYVIILTNVTRCTFRNNNWEMRDYSVTMKLREDVHNAIKADLNL